MEPIEIGIWVSGGLLLMVVLGMRVAFAAGLAGFVGLVWLRWNGFDYDPDRFWKALEISVKIAGSGPPFQGVRTGAVADPGVHHDRLSGLLRQTDHRALLRPANAGLPGCRAGLAVSTVFCHGGLCRRVWRVRGHGGGLCPHRHPRNAQDRL